MPRATVKEYEDHPEGFFPLCVKGCEETTSKKDNAPRFKWSVESTERMEDGSPFILSVWTSTFLSPKSQLTLFLEACGYDNPTVAFKEDGLDTDEVHGRVFEGFVVNENGFSNIKEFRRPKPKTRGTKGKSEETFVDPFAKDE